mmetsp:Transcript_14826/g.35350  ORF Transcript_14826/g.35350 Transcript_14826/m.35350 type:complete len:93 (+) Transcript_14826:816-1094(+)
MSAGPGHTLAPDEKDRRHMWTAKRAHRDRHTARMTDESKPSQQTAFCLPVGLPVSLHTHLELIALCVGRFKECQKTNACLPASLTQTCDRRC